MKIEFLENECCGCGACRNICPKQCITMQPNEEGFLFPKIDHNQCVNCLLCENVCPEINKTEKQNLQKAYYGWHKDENIRKLSSSGGAFSALAESVLSSGGVVFGAAFDEKSSKVYHMNSQKVGLDKLRRSKYVESNTETTFQEVKALLMNGTAVLYCGTPCQIHGLTNFLGKEYDNLITCDFVCHGVTPMELLKNHLDYLSQKHKSKVIDVNFRPKTFGWSPQAIKYNFENGTEYVVPCRLDSYFEGFMSRNLFLRKNCYSCRYKNNHTADIILADFWGVRKFKPEINDEKGMSLIITNSLKGEVYIKNIEQIFALNQLDFQYAEYVFKAKQKNEHILNQRKQFFEVLKKQGFEKAAYQFYMKDAWKYKMKLLLKKILK